ncbi:calcium/calmodulin-dependent protein kinase type IV-like isoform X2 [Sycon ciliatum]|uniref:calcium/calmodulin-dependent protein kinase type IV-like isoform X2 n=1 Tax=Sycon ciliatum TaxID=27933 RepID=UPI0031F6269E
MSESAGGKDDDVRKHYEVLDQLGRGVTSVVKRCKHRQTGKEYALKCIDKETFKKIAEVEVDIMIGLDHPNIIKLREMFETSNEVQLILELVTGGELFDRIIDRGSYTEKDASDAVRQVLEAVAYLHERKIIHRDLKPENLLYESAEPDAPIKLADFGLSRVMNASTAKMTVCGTPGYVAPEVLRGKAYNSAVDLWAIGVIAYILLCGFEPFFEEDDQRMFMRIIQCDFEFVPPYWDHISGDAKDLISKLLVLNPQQRLTASQALQHPWVKGDTTPTVRLDKTLENLREFNSARKKFKLPGVVVCTCRKRSAALSPCSA